MKYMYKKLKESEAPEVPEGLSVEIVQPKIFGGLILPGEEKSLKLMGVRLMFQLATLGKARLFVCRENGKLAHTNYLIPKCYKFPFLSKDDYEIGPGFTHPDFRGRGIFQLVLRHMFTSGNDNTVFYIMVDETNASCIRGLEKVGCERCGDVRLKGLLKVYELV